MPRKLLLTAVLLSFACAEPELVVLDEPGDDLGVARYAADVRVRGDESVATDIFVPVEVVEDPPIVVFIQGGAVDAARYDWIGERLARAGVTSIHPRHPTNLAFFSAGNAADVLVSLRRLGTTAGHPLEGRVGQQRATVVGHSLGGVVAAGAWAKQPELFANLALLASFPSGGLSAADREAGSTDRVLVVVGGEDPRVTLDQARSGLEQLQPDGVLARIEGATHYQFADGATSSEAESDGEPTIDLSTAHHRIFFLVHALADDPGALDEPQSWPDGVVTP